MSPLLSLQGVSVGFPVGDVWLPVVRNLSLDIEVGEFVGLVGESGSGKSMSALAILRLLPPPAGIVGGRLLLEGRDMLSLSEAQISQVRGRRIGIVFQEPMAALNPVFTIGFQVADAVRGHRTVSRRQALDEAVRLLDLVALPSARKRLDDYPHQLSGGQRQRVLIAIALAGQPDLLIADEPTTALDVTVQAQILDLLERLRQRLGLAVLLISHDLAIVAETCDRVVVMYAGESVEHAPVELLFRAPAHPYTRGLLDALPRLGRPVRRGELPNIPGQVPSLDRLPSGCSFHPRCSEVMDHCRRKEPALYRIGATDSLQTARCFLYADSTPTPEGTA